MEDTTLESMLLECDQAEGKQEKIKAKMKICYHLHSKRQIDEGRKHGEEIFLMAEEIGDKSSICQIHTLIAQGYLSVGKKESAKEYLDKALVVVEEIENPTLFGVICVAYSNLEFISSNYDIAIEWLQKAEKAFILNDQTHRLPLIYVNFGNSYLMLKKYDLAMEYYHKAVDMLKDSDERFRVFDCIAVVYHHVNDFERADDYMKKAYKYYHDINDKQYLAQCASFFGIIKLARKQYNNALKYAQEALILAEDLKFGMVQFRALVIIAQVYLEIDEIDKAKEYYERALELENTCYDKAFLKRFYENYGILLIKLNNTELAKEYNEKYEAVAKELDK